MFITPFILGVILYLYARSNEKLVRQQAADGASLAAMKDSFSLQTVTASDSITATNDTLNQAVSQKAGALSEAVRKMKATVARNTELFTKFNEAIKPLV
jgi:S-adenosylhomocysteine hydrolase